jgi:signal peptidase II
MKIVDHWLTQPASNGQALLGGFANGSTLIPVAPCLLICALAPMLGPSMRTFAFLSSAILFVALDQSVKALVLRLFREGQSICFGAVAIRKMINRRAFPGLLQSRSILLVVLVAEIGLFVLVLQFTAISGGPLAPYAYGAAIGGAASNALDQVLRGGVVDFIDLGFWPVFNLADVAIVAGIITGAFV